MTMDHHFLIDFHPSHDSDVVLVSPCSGHGFKFCAVVGEAVAELVTQGKTSHDISLFSIKARNWICLQERWKKEGHDTWIRQASCDTRIVNKSFHQCLLKIFQYLVVSVWTHKERPIDKLLIWLSKYERIKNGRSDLWIYWFIMFVQILLIIFICISLLIPLHLGKKLKYPFLSE